MKDRQKRLTDEQWELVGALLPPLQQPEAGPFGDPPSFLVNGALVVEIRQFMEGLIPASLRL